MAKILHTVIAAAVASASTLVPLSQSHAHDRRFEHYHGAGPGWMALGNLTASIIAIVRRAR